MPALQAYQAEAQVRNTNMTTALDAVKLGVQKRYAEPIARMELSKITLGNIKQYLDNQQLAPFVKTAVERAAEQLALAKATTSGAELKNEISLFEATLTRSGISPNGNIGTTIYKSLFGQGPNNFFQKSNKVMHKIGSKIEKFTKKFKK